MQEGESAAVACLWIDSPDGAIYTCMERIGIVGYLRIPFFSYFLCAESSIQIQG